jgi:peptidoglycan-associated lipoprotein
MTKLLASLATVLALTTAGLAAAATPGQLPDVIILANGDHVYGEVTDPGFELWLPSGTQRFTREHVVTIILAGAVGDTVLLRNGSRLSGLVSHGFYTIHTKDGRDLRFARAEVKEVLLAGGAPPAAAAPAAPAAVPAPAPGPAAAPPPAPAAPAPPAPGGPTTPPAPPAALPAAVRTALRDIHFAFDRSDLTPEARQTLDALAEALRNFPNLTLLVEGHADERGTPEYNLALGARRADAAKAYLVSRGMAANRIATVSYGEERPLDPAHTEAAWTLNRRAHFVVRQEP